MCNRYQVQQAACPIAPSIATGKREWGYMATVLVVDDDEEVRNPVRIVLRMLGHDVEEVEDGERSIDLYNQNSIGIGNLTESLEALQVRGLKASLEVTIVKRTVSLRAFVENVQTGTTQRWPCLTMWNIHGELAQLEKLTRKEIYNEGALVKVIAKRE